MSASSFGPAGPKSAACFGPRTKSTARFRPTHPFLVRPGLAVAVTVYPRVIRMRAHWIAIAISSTERAYED